MFQSSINQFFYSKVFNTFSMPILEKMSVYKFKIQTNNSTEYITYLSNFLSTKMNQKKYSAYSKKWSKKKLSSRIITKEWFWFYSMIIWYMKKKEYLKKLDFLKIWILIENLQSIILRSLVTYSTMLILTPLPLKLILLQSNMY